VVTSYTSVNALLTTAVPKTAILPAAVQVNAPVGIRVILPPPKEIGLGAVIFTIAVVPETNAIDVVGAIVVAEAIVGAAAVVATKLEYFIFVKVGLPVQLVNTPLVGVPNMGVTITILVLVQAEILPLTTVPNIGAVIVGEVSVGVAIVGLVPKTNAPDPVSSVTAVFKLALLGVAKKVATPDPKPVTPVLIGSPVQLVNTPDTGVPSAGVTNVGPVKSS
jgi:hypothetical protein